MHEARESAGARVVRLVNLQPSGGDLGRLGCSFDDDVSCVRRTMALIAVAPELAYALSKLVVAVGIHARPRDDPPEVGAAAVGTCDLAQRRQHAAVLAVQSAGGSVEQCLLV